MDPRVGKSIEDGIRQINQVYKSLMTGNEIKITEVTHMDRKWTCPYCKSDVIKDYNKVKTYNRYETIDVECDNCDCHYLIYSDQDPENDGSLCGQFQDEDMYSEEDKKSAYGDQLYHEARDEGII